MSECLIVSGFVGIIAFFFFRVFLGKSREQWLAERIQQLGQEIENAPEDRREPLMRDRARLITELNHLERS